MPPAGAREPRYEGAGLVGAALALGVAGRFQAVVAPHVLTDLGRVELHDAMIPRSDGTLKGLSPERSGKAHGDTARFCTSEPVPIVATTVRSDRRTFSTDSVLVVVAT